MASTAAADALLMTEHVAPVIPTLGANGSLFGAETHRHTTRLEILLHLSNFVTDKNVSRFRGILTIN